jgi:hypothetical protein
MYGNDQLADSPSFAAAREAPAQERFQGQTAARAAVLRCFCDPVPAQCARLESLSAGAWKRLLRWLDFSGLALYFLDRMNELETAGWLPLAILAELQHNAEDNAERTRALIAEAGEIEFEFQRRSLSHAVLKGFSLWPHSVPKLELRAQSDLDYLVAEKDADEARRVLEAKGYYRHAVSGRTWEFKTHAPPARPLEDLYKPRAHPSVELHLEMRMEAGRNGAHRLLERTEVREFHGLQMPVLAAVDLFLWQGMHVFKHLSQDLARASHLLEFRRHAMARQDGAGFWRQVQSMAGASPRMVLGLGVVTRLIEVAFGSFTPEGLRCWSADRLPEGLQLCVDTYAYRSVLAGFPGNKLCLLLQQELALAGIPAKRTLREQLLPLRLPPAMEHAPRNESLAERIARMRRRLGFLLFRLRYHLVSGIQYAWAAAQWQRQRKGRA